ncbi:MAG: hypothetical protein L0Z62_03570 [Gemmataceae bacterium]|nr:hypothetical protein [Gemmataceae bacterium]
MLNKIYVACASAVLALYGLVAFAGWEFGDPQRRIVPASARQPGWARSSSSHFWYAGYRGGK